MILLQSPDILGSFLCQYPLLPTTNRTRLRHPLTTPCMTPSDTLIPESSYFRLFFDPGISRSDSAPDFQQPALKKVVYTNVREF